MVRLPNGDDIGYKLYLITGIWAKLQSNIDVMLAKQKFHGIQFIIETKR